MQISFLFSLCSKVLKKHENKKRQEKKKTRAIRGTRHKGPTNLSPAIHYTHTTISPSPTACSRRALTACGTPTKHFMLSTISSFFSSSLTKLIFVVSKPLSAPIADQQDLQFCWLSTALSMVNETAQRRILSARLNASRQQSKPLWIFHLHHGFHSLP